MKTRVIQDQPEKLALTDEDVVGPPVDQDPRPPKLRPGADADDAERSDQASGGTP
jgi:hypothetical protein